jgi:soluble P-type ATPase
MTIAQSGMTVDEFEKMVHQWIKNAKHPTTGKLFSKMVFQPMLELIKYLQNNKFKVYIVSGGGIDFIRVWASDIYGIPKENVIGSFAKPIYKKINGRAVLVKTNNIVFINDGSGKPVAIHQAIGEKPLMAFGNSDGDIQMLEWCTANKKANLAAFVHHTDAKREWAYDKNTNTGKLNKGLALAKKNSWMLIDIKNDWKIIYPFELNEQTAQN